MNGVERTTLVTTENARSIRDRIFTVRGAQVMLDRDLAELYGVPTKALNQAVKRNADRFPDGFMFQLTRGEFDSLRSQFVTSNGATRLPGDSFVPQVVISRRGGPRYKPYAFTEQLGRRGNARPAREEAQGRLGRSRHIAARQQAGRNGCREVQRAVWRPIGQDERGIPRPLPRHRRQGSLPCRRVAQGPREEVLRLHEDGRRRDRRAEGEDMKKRGFLLVRAGAEGLSSSTAATLNVSPLGESDD